MPKRSEGQPNPSLEIMAHLALWLPGGGRGRRDSGVCLQGSAPDERAGAGVRGEGGRRRAPGSSALISPGGLAGPGGGGGRPGGAAGPAGGGGGGGGGGFRVLERGPFGGPGEGAVEPGGAPGLPSPRGGAGGAGGRFTQAEGAIAFGSGGDADDFFGALGSPDPSPRKAPGEAPGFGQAAPPAAAAPAPNGAGGAPGFVPSTAAPGGLFGGHQPDDVDFFETLGANGTPPSGEGTGGGGAPSSLAPAVPAHAATAGAPAEMAPMIAGVSGLTLADAGAPAPAAPASATAGVAAAAPPRGARRLRLRRPWPLPPPPRRSWRRRPMCRPRPLSSLEWLRRSRQRLPLARGASRPRRRRLLIRATRGLHRACHSGSRQPLTSRGYPLPRRLPRRSGQLQRRPWLPWRVASPLWRLLPPRGI